MEQRAICIGKYGPVRQRQTQQTFRLRQLAARLEQTREIMNRIGISGARWPRHAAAWLPPGQPAQFPQGAGVVE